MDNRGASAGLVLVALAAIMVAAVLLFMGQIGIAIIVVILALIVAASALFARARTPTD